jgi:glycosyltransferase involved in cell wall biosynthesis
VQEVVQGMRERVDAFEVIVVENGSRDRTAEVAKSLADTYPELRASSINAADYGKALREGLMLARYDYVVNFDVDLYDLDFLERAVDRISQPNGPSIVVASKRAEGSNDTRHWTRKVVTGVFSTLLRVGFGLKVSDTHGMKAMRRADVRGVAERCLFGTDLFDTELVLRTERAGFRTSEIGVMIVEKRPARTPIAGRIFRSVRGLGVLWFALRKENRLLGNKSK